VTLATKGDEVTQGSQGNNSRHCVHIWRNVGVGFQGHCHTLDNGFTHIAIPQNVNPPYKLVEKQTKNCKYKKQTRPANVKFVHGFVRPQDVLS
jgi:hypothetical protein